MAPTTPLGVPTTAAAGDTWLWTASYGDYPVSEGWTLSYRFRGASILDTSSSHLTNDGATWTATIPATLTADLTPGNYAWSAVMTGSGSYAGRLHTAETGVLQVTRNLSLAAEGDGQTWEERTLSVIESVLTNKVTDDVAMYMIGTRQVLAIPLKELLSLRSQLKRKVAAQRDPRAAFPLHRVTFHAVS